MKIYISKDQRQLGPYTPDEVRARIAAGEFVANDLGWHADLPHWIPISQLLGTVPGVPGSMPPVPLQSSGIATASFIIAIIGIVGWIVIFGLAGSRVSAGVHEHDPVLMWVGLLTLAGLPTNLVGAILGFVVISKPVSNRWMAITGAVLNCLQFLGVLSLILIGLAHRRH